MNLQLINRVAAILFVMPSIWGVADPLTTKPTIVVATAPVIKEKRIIPIKTSGRLAYKKETRLAFKTSGLINRIHVDEGETFQQGDTLASLDLAEINAQVTSTESNVAKAKRDLIRFTDLYKKNVIPLQQLQDAQTALHLAESELKIATFNRRHSIIKAPFNGKVLQRFTEENELINAGSPLFTVAKNQNSWVVRVGLADRDVVKTSVQDPVKLAFDAYPQTLFTGKITKIAAVADLKTGTFEIEVSLNNPPLPLRSGFIARVDILPKSTQPLAFIPIEAIVTAKSNQAMVFAYDQQTSQVSQHWVTLAGLLNKEMAVRSGLENVTEVVTEGASYLKDGMTVQRVTATNANELRQYSGL
ncbi:efflux RND transporter periplasmic adaptor subunit [Endozoicomonas sp. SM1973]|uniref:Efflux RND transporter periplasmic adaptor subunit n=1 Tax=Spartinivicinus marinus TaxID=2994442 RepID=A0A853I9X0_9GAMM|nr:efflux RND transporter periplasmic adaptor subunit [Spartinivicinus marinus]MCX4027103.1 efflux RND transporter periplasmic adaptor subunit [Spartinivicinus marinus]NYZ68582.1 efflux RND transporter periplasmic adaptor subunit [Spartinivicinus marinus]